MNRTDQDRLDHPARLQALQRLQILDTAEEQRFDEITRMAADICRTPIALISLVDDKRQWFKSRIGVDVKETPREIAFCAHTVALHEPLIVTDATKDPRFSANPFVTGDPGVRFYAGAPLITSRGHAIGTLCVVDSVPRQISWT